MVADLVGDDVGLRELTRCAEFLLEHLVEAQVDVDLLVVRAVEGTHRRLTPAARGRPAPGKEDELGWLVGAARRAEHVGPDLLGAAQHLRDEARTGVVAGRRRRRPLLLDDGAAIAAAHQSEQRERIDAEDPAGDHRDHDAADAEPAAADAEAAAAAAAAHATNVLDVAAFFLAVHAHVDTPG